jgi:hypothetical protein
MKDESNDRAQGVDRSVTRSIPRRAGVVVGVSTLCHVMGGVTWRKPSIIDLTYIYILRKDSKRAFPGGRSNIALYLSKSNRNRSLYVVNHVIIVMIQASKIFSRKCLKLVKVFKNNTGNQSLHSVNIQ